MMKRSKILEKRRTMISEETREWVDFSFKIANRIHCVLASKGLTQKDLATKLGKSEAEISKWMRGTHNFTISTIKKIEVALDCEILSVKKTLDGSVFFLYNSSYTTYPISKSVKNADTIVNASNGLKMVYNGN